MSSFTDEEWEYISSLDAINAPEKTTRPCHEQIAFILSIISVATLALLITRGI